VSDIQIVFSVIAGVIVLFIWDRLPVITVCLGCALALWATGLLSIGQSLAGFGDPATIFVASLFVISAGLEITGVTAWAGQVLIAQAGESRARLLVFMMLLVGVLSALISLNGAVAALLPVIVVLAVRLGRPPSQLMMPLVFGGHAGSMLLLTGSPVNVLVMEASADAGAGGFGYFEFALAGIPLVIGCIAIAIFLGPILLPKRESKNLPPDLSRHAHTLVEQFRLSENVHAVQVGKGSPLEGFDRSALDLAELSGRQGLGLMAMKTAEGRPVDRDRIAAGDVLLLKGDAGAISEVAGKLGVAEAGARPRDLAESLFNRRSGLAEVIVPPRSALIGQRFFQGMVTESGDLIVLGIQRQGETLSEGADLAAGDVLLLQGTWQALEERLDSPEVLSVNAPEIVRRQAVPLGQGAKQMVGIMAAMVVLLATGIVPPAVAGLLSAVAVILMGILTVDQAYRAVNWTTVILVGAMLPLATAMAETGAAELLADTIIAVAGDGGPRVFLAGLFVLTAVLGQVISNTATAIIIIPISIVAAEQMGISVQPVLMTVVIAAAGAFLTPVATPTNLMVMEPGGYRFGDYWKFGLPMMIWFLLVSVFLVPLIWSL
jgi:di/tricarboxylate transporter